jgi:NAD(P)-dependent dehydrogenase (short-subunit alcohol dehydrogenase family)
MQLRDAAALVTGGASGLGLATATALHSAGARVVIADLPSSRGMDLAAEHGFTFVATDVTDEHDVARAVEAATELGPLRVLVNCAGVATPGRAVGRDGALPLATFERVIAINLTGTFNAIRLAAQAMMATEPAGEERGVIITTASVAAFDGQVGQPAYAASKAGVAGMTLPLAREFAQHLIRVVSIAPGIFETPMLAGLPQEAQDSLGLQVPHPSRLGKPAEYAALALHIVENAMLNGETIRLDGAIRMQPK